MSQQQQLPGFPVVCCGHPDDWHLPIVISEAPPGNTYSARKCDACRCEIDVHDVHPTGGQHERAAGNR
jgi:hypothetical protein